MQTILITGANGFVSWYLLRDLLQDKYTIIATGKGSSRLSFTDKNLTYEPLDFTIKADVNTIFERYRPNIVVHAGALSKPDECELNKDAAFTTNVLGTENLLEAAAACKSYFLYVSSDFVFEGKKLQYKEEDERNPVNYYGQTKKQAEEAVQNYPFGWSIVRTVLVYGKPRSGRQNILTIVANALQKGEPLKIFSDQTRTPTYVEDLAAALKMLIDAKRTGVYHVSGTDAVTPYQMAVAVAEYLGYDAQQIENVTVETFKQPAARPPITGLDLTKARTELLYIPISFEEGLRKTFEA